MIIIINWANQVVKKPAQAGFLLPGDQAFRIDQASGNHHYFVPRLAALKEFDVAQRYRKNTRNKFQQGFIGTPFDGRCGQSYFERIAVQPGYFAALGTGLNMQGEQDDIIPAAIPLCHLHQPHLQKAERDTFQHAYRHYHDQLTDDEQQQCGQIHAAQHRHDAAQWLEEPPCDGIQQRCERRVGVHPG